MNDCIFCKIVRGEIPAYKVYEDEESLAFLDITQVVDGHTLLIPKKHVRWVWDTNETVFFGAAKKIVSKMQEVTGEEFVMSITLGLMVPHAHLHLLPSNTEGNLDLVFEAWEKAKAARKLPSEKLSELAEKFRVGS